MTHTLHRTGLPDDLRQDYVLLAMAATGHTHLGSAETKRAIFEILQKHPHANCGDVKTGSLFNSDVASIIKGFVDTSVVHYVFTDKQTVVKVLEELREADLGVSIVVSGIIGEVGEACRCAGLTPHTVEYSGGVMGRTERLPAEEVLAVTTMCGHGLVAGNLVLDMVRKVRRGKLDLRRAAETLAKPCLCGIFNPDRAERLLAKLI